MKPHVDLICEDDYVWHPAELPSGEGRARERRLSVDEEDGSSSLSMIFDTDWERAGGVHHADTEYFVLEGQLDVAGQTIGRHGYLRAPGGLAVPPIKASAGTRILYWREHGDAGFDVTADSRKEAAGLHLTVVDSERLKWEEAPEQGPSSPLYIKMLHHDERTDYYTRLFWATPGWGDDRIAHHPVFEEVYTLSGRMTYNLGTFEPGAYVYRPPRIKHGHFHVPDPAGCVWIIRSGGALTNFYTADSWIKWDGKAMNYDPDVHGPVISSFPVRSRSRGTWDGVGM